MAFIHKELAAGRWQTYPLVFQLAQVGSEVERAVRWRERGDQATSWTAFERALELLDLTLADPRWKGRHKEIARLRELLVDYFAGSNIYGTNPLWLRKYFLDFAYAARRSAASRLSPLG